MKRELGKREFGVFLSSPLVTDRYGNKLTMKGEGSRILF